MRKENPMPNLLRLAGWIVGISLMIFFMFSSESHGHSAYSKRHSTENYYTPIRPQERFFEFDKNEDNVVDFNEFSAILKGIFDRIDTDGNGKLSFDEMLKDHMKRYGE